MLGEEKGGGGGACFEEFAVHEHAFFQAGVEEVDVVFHQFVDCAGDFLGAGAAVAVVRGFFAVDAGHEGVPVWLDDFRGAVVCCLLDEDEHSRSKRPGFTFPHFQSWVTRLVRPA